MLDIVGGITWQSGSKGLFMALRAGRFSGNSRLQQASNSNPSMKQGEKGEAVAIVQQALVDLGFGMPRTTKNGHTLTDGVFGEETANIIRQFQKKYGLVVDGIAGRQTLAKLDEQVIVQSRLADMQSRMYAGNDFELRTCKPLS